MKLSLFTSSQFSNICYLSVSTIENTAHHFLVLAYVLINKCYSSMTFSVYYRKRKLLVLKVLVAIISYLIRYSSSLNVMLFF